MPKMPHRGNNLSVLKRKCPYHANVIKLLDITNKIIVRSPFPINMPHKNKQKSSSKMIHTDTEDLYVIIPLLFGAIFALKI
jgi:hypothetical protein